MDSTFHTHLLIEIMQEPLPKYFWSLITLHLCIWAKSFPSPWPSTKFLMTACCCHSGPQSIFSILACAYHQPFKPKLFMIWWSCHPDGRGQELDFILMQFSNIFIFFFIFSLATSQYLTFHSELLGHSSTQTQWKSSVAMIKWSSWSQLELLSGRPWPQN